MAWTLADIQRLELAGKIRGFNSGCSVSRVKAKKPIKSVKKEPKALREIKKALQNANIAYECEYKFHPKRKFRFDIAVPGKMIAIEYEGIVSAKSRHTSVTGYTRDATKYNLAASAGWRVYRYTALNYKDFETDIKNIIE